MNTSEKIDDLTKAMCEARPKFRTIYKGKLVTIKHKTGGEHSFRYAPQYEIIDATEVALTNAGLYVKQSDNNGVMITRIDHVSGQWEESTCNIEYSGKGPQEYGAALTFARRYGYMMALGICPEDGNEPGPDDTSGMVTEDMYPPKNSHDPRWQGPLTKTDLCKHNSDYSEQFGNYKTVGELTVIAESPEFKEFIDQANHDYPGLINGEKFFDEWVSGLKHDFAQRKKELEMLSDHQPIG